MENKKTRSLSTKDFRLLKKRYDHSVKVLMEITRDWTEHLKQSPATNASNNFLAETMKTGNKTALNIKSAKLILKQNNLKI